jgi:hypothetical protein
VQSSKRTISPLSYFILVSSLTNLTFLVVGIFILALFSVKLSSILLAILIFLLLWKGALVGLVSWFWYKRANNKEFLVKFIGIYLGRFFGIFLGGFLVYRIFGRLQQSETIGFLVGAFAFYFAGRWIGSKLSVLIGRQLDTAISVPEMQIAQQAADPKSIRRFVSVGYISYGVLFPLLLVALGFVMEYFEVPIGFLPEFLPISRIIIIGLSIFSIAAPWLLKNRWRNKYKALTPSPESMIYWLGLVFSIVPAMYGFILFFAMGASILELFLYAVASSIAATIWTNCNKISVGQNAG